MNNTSVTDNDNNDFYWHRTIANIYDVYFLSLKTREVLAKEANISVNTLDRIFAFKFCPNLRIVMSLALSLNIINLTVRDLKHFPLSDETDNPSED